MSMDCISRKRQWLVIVALMMAIALIINVDATLWFAKIKTNATSWSIERNSQNISFELTQSIQGRVSPVDYNGRSLNPYHSSYYELKENDVSLSSRTSALEGNYSLEESIFLESDTTDPISLILNKVPDTSYIIINYFESRPVVLKSSRMLNYSGKNINDKRLLGNNNDYLTSNFLHNKKLFSKTNAGMLLTDLNVTALGMLLPVNSVSNDTLVSVNFKPNRATMYSILAESTGIADLKYKLTDSEYDFKHSTYPTTIESDERYIGSFNIRKSIHSISAFSNSTTEADEMPCCFDGHSDLLRLPEDDLGLDVRKIFDCSCYSSYHLVVQDNK